jgi:hypothetical protein
MPLCPKVMQSRHGTACQQHRKSNRVGTGPTCLYQSGVAIMLIVKARPDIVGAGGDVESCRRRLRTACHNPETSCSSNDRVGLAICKALGKLAIGFQSFGSPRSGRPPTTVPRRPTPLQNDPSVCPLELRR